MTHHRPLFPFDLPNWAEVRSLLNELKENCIAETFDAEEIARHIQIIYEVNHLPVIGDKSENSLSSKTVSEVRLKYKRDKKKVDQSFLWFGVLKFIRKASEEEIDQFLFSSLPGICDLILESEKLIPEDLCFSEQQKNSTTVLSRQCVASILACSFMCLFPERERSRSAKLNVINFTNFFKQLPLSSQMAKMHCILNYFARVTEPCIELTGNITYTRQVVDNNVLPTMEDMLTSDAELCPMFIHSEGFIEDIEGDGIEVDFANRCIGGGALGRGRVQEEIRFNTCPELIASMLFMETMQNNEAIIISGFEQYSQHSGYASGLEYVCNYNDEVELDEEGNRKRVLCAIDATPFKSGKHRQYFDRNVLRELNKAVVGFCDVGASNLDTSSLISLSSSQGHNTSTEEEYHTAVTSPSDEGNGQRRLSGFVVTLLSQAMHQAVKDSVEKHRSDEEDQASHNQASHNQSTDNKNCDQSKSGNDSQSDLNIPDMNQSEPANTNGSACDRNHNQVTRTTHPQNGSCDLLEVNYSEWLSNFRRRSSNLSDVSRRSSSSTKQSSDLSSDLEEIYESYLTNEKKKHVIIEEETSNTGITDFATKLVACLMQEGTSTAAQMLPGMPMFSNKCPSYDVVKPHPLRPDPSEDLESDDVPASVSDVEDCEDAEPSLPLQNYAQSVMDATFPLAFQEVARLALSNSSSQLDPAYQDLPTDRMYEWYADQIVQQVFLHVSQELAQQEVLNPSAQFLSPDVANASCDVSTRASVSTHSPDSSSSLNSTNSTNLTSSASGASASGVSISAPIPKSSEHSDSSEPNVTEDLHGQTEDDVPVQNSTEDSISDTNCDSDQKNAETNISESVIDTQNLQSLSCDTRTSTPKPDLVEEQVSSIPEPPEKKIELDIKLDYHEAAAIIVDHVFQTLPSHCAAPSPVSHNKNGKSTVMCSLASKESHNSLSDNVSNDGRESIRVSKSEEVAPEKLSRAGLPNVGILTKKLSREMLTNAFLNVEDRRHIKSYERRSSEPCHVSVELSLQALNSNRLHSRDDDKKRKISRTDDDLEKVRGEAARRGSWSSFPTSRRRSSCGFKDPILSKFAEELMKADTTIPPLLIMGAQTSTSTTGSRRSSLSGFRDATLANLENELLNSSFCLPSSSSPRHSIRSKGSRKGREKFARSESSDTEYYFPLPRKLGTECQEELLRTGYYHSVDEIEDFADFFAQDILNQAVSIIYRDAYLAGEVPAVAQPEHIQCYAEELATSVIRSALGNLQQMSADEVNSILNTSKSKVDDSSDPPTFLDALDIPYARLEEYADNLSGKLLKEALIMLQKHDRCKSRLGSRGLAIATGNWGCGAFGGDPQLKSLLQWMAASVVHVPGLHYYTFNDGRLIQFDEIVAVIQSLGWTVGRLMNEVKGYCDMIQAEYDQSSDPDFSPSITLFEYIVSNIYM